MKSKKRTIRPYRKRKVGESKNHKKEKEFYTIIKLGKKADAPKESLGPVKATIIVQSSLEHLCAKCGKIIKSFENHFSYVANISSHSANRYRGDRIHLYCSRILGKEKIDSIKGNKYYVVIRLKNENKK